MQEKINEMFDRLEQIDYSGCIEDRVTDLESQAEHLREDVWALRTTGEDYWS